jgi:hypothetical protein
MNSPEELRAQAQVFACDVADVVDCLNDVHPECPLDVCSNHELIIWLREAVDELRDVIYDDVRTAEKVAARAAEVGGLAFTLALKNKAIYPVASNADETKTEAMRFAVDSLVGCYCADEASQQLVEKAVQRHLKVAAEQTNRLVTMQERIRWLEQRLATYDREAASPAAARLARVALAAAETKLRAIRDLAEADTIFDERG